MAEPKPFPPVSTFRPTLEGLFWLMAALVLLSQGWLRGVNLVALIACFLIALWVLNLLWVLLRFRLKRLRLRRHLEEPVFVGQTIPVTVELENPTSRGFRGLRIEDRAPLVPRSWVVPLLRGRAVTRERYDITFRRRGRFAWLALRLTTGYPLGLFRRTVRFQPAQETIVLPRLGNLHGGRLRRLLRHRPEPILSTKRLGLRHAAAQSEFYGLREYRTGDSLRWIHWRTSARVGELMVREFEEPPSDNLTLILEPWLPAPASELEAGLGKPDENPKHRLALDHLELAISLAATVCWEWCRQPGAQLALGIAGWNAHMQVTETGTKHVFPLLRSLALVEGCPLPDAPGMGERLRRSRLPPGPVLIVTTHASSLPAALSVQLRRSVAVLDVSERVVDDFFSVRPIDETSGTRKEESLH